MTGSGLKGGGEAGHEVSVIKTVEDFICKQTFWNKREIYQNKNSEKSINDQGSTTSQQGKYEIPK